MLSTAKQASLSLALQRFSYRFAEQVLNSKLTTKEEIEQVLLGTTPELAKLSRPAFNKLLLDRSSITAGRVNLPFSMILLIQERKWTS
jgi:hypothetical protein